MSTTLPTAADLDAVAAETAIKKATAAPIGEVLDIKELNADARRYLLLRDKEQAAKKAADAIKPRLLLAAERFGMVPDGAPKSRRIETRSFVVTRTVGSSTEVKDANVTELELTLAKARLSTLFPLLFERHVEYTLVDGADAALAEANLPKKAADAIRALYGRCFGHKTKTPSLDVVTTRVFKATAAKKAAKQSAKKAKAA